MRLSRRIALLQALGAWMESGDPAWAAARKAAQEENPWFVQEFIDYQCAHIRSAWLGEDQLSAWVSAYPVPDEPGQGRSRLVGLITAGNIPLAGFHDLIAVFLAGHRALIRPSEKDRALTRALVEQLHRLDPDTRELVQWTEGMLRDCDAYIATGSTNSSRYFEYYFRNVPHIIRHNRSSVAILDGTETPAELSGLADDIHLYFGLGCRNVSRLHVPEGYRFEPLLEALRRYAWIMDLHKYRHNFDYQLALLILNRQYYMTNGSVLLREDTGRFAPVSVVHYASYPPERPPLLQQDDDTQAVVGHGYLPFGSAQTPDLSDYADGKDTLRFLLDLG